MTQQQADGAPSRGRQRLQALFAAGMKFLVVGGVGFVVDVTLFNLLRIGVFGTDVPWQSPLLAKTISVSVAIVVNWLGNRSWTFRSQRDGRRPLGLEFVQVALVSLGGMALTLLCLWLSHYVFGFRSIVADNIASNVVGLALGTAFRFCLLRFWVYREREAVTTETAEAVLLAVPSPSGARDA